MTQMSYSWLRVLSEHPRFQRVMSGGPAIAGIPQVVRFLCASLGCCLVGCLITNRTDAPVEENFPPAIESPVSADHPLGEIVRLDPLESPEEAASEEIFEFIVRDPNEEQTLQYKVFLDRVAGATPPPPISETEIASTGSVERLLEFSVPRDTLTAAPCRKLELIVTGEFRFGTLAPTLPGDISTAVWWIMSSPTIERTDCPQ